MIVVIKTIGLDVEMIGYHLALTETIQNMIELWTSEGQVVLYPNNFGLSTIKILLLHRILS